MTPLDQFLQALLTVNFWSVVKWLMILGLGLYTVFAVVVIRQVQLMSRTLNGALELPLWLMAWIHLGMTLMLLLVALVIL